MNGNPVEWLQHLKSMVKPIYGNLYKEMVNRDYCDDYQNAVRDAFNPVDVNNLTRSEEIELVEFVEFIIRESAQQTSDVNVDTLCAKMQNEIFHHRQDNNQNLYEYKEATECSI